MKEKNIYSNIYKLNLFWFFQSFIFHYVIERLYAVERGLTIQQTVYLEIIYAITIMVFEIPSGIISDIWSRRNVMILSAFFNFLDLYILATSTSFAYFALWAFLAAISGSLHSGTSNSLYYDSLKQVNQEADFEKHIGFCGLLSSLSSGLGAIIGSFTAIKFGYTFNVYLSLFSVLISVIVAFTLIEPKKSEEFSEESKKIPLKEIISFYKSDYLLFYITIISISMMASISYVDEYWQIYFEKVGVPLYLFGIYSVSRESLSSLSNFLAYKVKEKFSLKNIFFVSFIFSAFCITLSGLIANKFGIVFMMIVFIALGIVEVLSIGYIHSKVDSIYRATTESVFALADNTVTILAGLLFGYITTYSSIFDGFIFLGLFMIMSFLILKSIFKVMENVE